MAFIVLKFSVRVCPNCLRLWEYVCVSHSHSKTVKSIFSGKFLRATQLLQEIDLECPESIALAPRPSSLRSYSSDASWQDTLGVNWHASAASDSSRSSILLASSGNRLDSAERNNRSELLHADREGTSRGFSCGATTADEMSHLNFRQIIFRY